MHLINCATSCRKWLKGYTFLGWVKCWALPQECDIANRRLELSFSPWCHTVLCRRNFSLQREMPSKGTHSPKLCTAVMYRLLTVIMFEKKFYYQHTDWNKPPENQYNNSGMTKWIPPSYYSQWAWSCRRQQRPSSLSQWVKHSICNTRLRFSEQDDALPKKWKG